MNGKKIEELGAKGKQQCFARADVRVGVSRVWRSETNAGYLRAKSSSMTTLCASLLNRVLNRVLLYFVRRGTRARRAANGCSLVCPVVVSAAAAHTVCQIARKASKLASNALERVGARAK